MTYIKARKLEPRRSAAAISSIAGGTATLVTGLMLSMPAHAADAASSSATLPAVNVVDTADNGYKATQSGSPKFTQPLVDTTQTVTVVTKQVMQEQNATTLTDAMRNVAGAGTFYAGENGSTASGDAIYMRGLDTSNSIYIDGIRDTNTTHRDMFNTEQVEVIQGPSGSDYGRGAPTGSINLISKQPTLVDDLEASAVVGTNNYTRATVDWNHAINETTAARLNVMGHKEDVAGRDNVDNQRWGIAPSVAFGLNTPTTVYIDYLHVKQNNTPDGLIPTIGLPGYTAPSAAFAALGSAPKVDTHNFYGLTTDHDNSQTDMATVKVEHQINPTTTLRNITRYGETKQDYMATSFMLAAANLAKVTADPTSWTMTRSPNVNDTFNKILSNQTNVTSKFNTGSLKHDLSAGFELTREEQTVYGHATAVEPVVSIYAPNSNVAATNYGRNGADAHGTTDTIAAYAFDTIALTPQWEVNGGIRVDHYKTDYDSATACGGTGRTVVACPRGAAAGTPVQTINTDTSGNLVNWKAGALYHINEQGNVYVNFALSQQPPGGSNFALAAATPTGNSANRVDFAPQKAKTGEIGTKWELFEKRLLATAALFRTDINNEVSAVGDGTYQQIGKKRVQGIELTAQGQITPNWSITGGYIYQDATVEAGTAVAADGSQVLTYTPKNAFTSWTTYTLPKGFTVGGGARYVGGLAKGTDGAIGTPTHTDAYWVVDAMASYKVSRNLTMQLNVYNLFNEDYVLSINKSGYRYTPGAPRTALLTANVSY
ncbi:catecholate siderophore receptor Fiu [Amantichitinum ursilacus]|uniref:Catecholate siderophore receptor Fiu n=1 Tax=Amantichitinum ursilacus TaxID=857265 RepID=A0A0N0XK71_9NEIS|nr:catecholate siderophore receptor Fiu [Amantichitinum ursilacus]KPC54201.1 Catecholate siderophore receptor Fiu precursor [Amantichitinum ursilacus]